MLRGTHAHASRSPICQNKQAPPAGSLEEWKQRRDIFEVAVSFPLKIQGGVLVLPKQHEIRARASGCDTWINVIRVSAPATKNRGNLTLLELP